MSVKIFEVTKENADKYIDQIAALEVVVLNAMEKEGRKNSVVECSGRKHNETRSQEA